MFTIFYSSKYMDMMGIYCADGRTVIPQNNKMSAEHSHSSQVLLIPLSGVCSMAYFYK